MKSDYHTNYLYEKNNKKYIFCYITLLIILYSFILIFIYINN